MEKHYTFTAVMVDDNLTYTSIEVCQKLNISELLLNEMEEQGLFKSIASEKQTEPLIQVQDLPRIEKAYHIHRDLEVNVAGVILVLELLDELQDLRHRLAILER
jgi:chaperone modulatory protein CbpM